jgi:hypothetical protein
VPGDKIVAFSGFQSMPATWKLRTPSAWIMGGEVVVTSPDSEPETLSIRSRSVQQARDHHRVPCRSGRFRMSHSTSSTSS